MTRTAPLKPTVSSLLSLSCLRCSRFTVKQKILMYQREADCPSINCVLDNVLLGSKSAELLLLKLLGGQNSDLCYSPIAVWTSFIRTVASPRSPLSDICSSGSSVIMRNQNHSSFRLLLPGCETVIRPNGTSGTRPAHQTHHDVPSLGIPMADVISCVEVQEHSGRYSCATPCLTEPSRASTVTPITLYPQLFPAKSRLPDGSNRSTCLKTDQGWAAFSGESVGNRSTTGFSHRPIGCYSTRILLLLGSMGPNPANIVLLNHQSAFHLSCDICKQKPPDGDLNGHLGRWREIS